MSKNTALKLIPVMMAFFVMGVCDLVGIAANYVKADFGLSDTLTNLLPFMVFLWFFILSVPTGILMNSIGRRNTVIISLAITLVSLLIPYISYTFGVMLLSFSLIGIGNTLLQVSLNPLLANIVDKERLSSSLTLGQSIKAIASFGAPIAVTWLAVRTGDWKMIFAAFIVITAVTIVCMSFTKIPRQKPDKASSFADCFRLLRDPFILVLFLGLLVHVGTDVGINTTAPKLLSERTGMPLSATGYAASAYFLMRILGCLAGIWILAKFAAKKVFFVSTMITALGVAGLFFAQSAWLIYTCIAMIGLGNANLFSIIFSQALLRQPMRNNEISGLMIMGVSGGALFPLLMGVGADLLGGQIGALIVLMLCVVYLLLVLAPRIKNQNSVESHA